MFKDIKYVRNHKFWYMFNSGCNIYLLIDDDFELEMVVNDGPGTSSPEFGMHLVDIYEKKNLNPIPNIILWNKWICCKFTIKDYNYFGNDPNLKRHWENLCGKSKFFDYLEENKLKFEKYMSLM